MVSFGQDENSAAFKKAFPENFKRHFFRVLKSVSDRKGAKMNYADVRKRTRKMPTSFVITSGPGSCKLHKHACPTENCPYTTMNKKVITTLQESKLKRAELPTRRQRVFYREDMKQKLKEVFMMTGDQLNCTFEPATGGLSYHSKRNADLNKIYETETDEKTFMNKLGDDLRKLHPEVLKIGKMKRAKLFYKNGEYAKAESTISEGFNIISLKKRFDPNYMKQLLVKKTMEKMRAERKNAEEAAKGGSNNPMRTAMVDSLAHMRERVEDQQEKIPPEDFENVKLFPVLKEAYEMIADIEKRKTKADARVKQINKAKADLQA
jgi:hypothetical protein